MTTLSTFIAPAIIFGLIGLRLYLGINAARTLESMPPELRAKLRSGSYVMD